jgi:serine/threonine protein kinase
MRDVYTLKYVAKGDIRKAIDNVAEWRGYTPDIRKQILRGVAERMHHLHTCNVNHRDLKRYDCMQTVRKLETALSGSSCLQYIFEHNVSSIIFALVITVAMFYSLMVLGQ